MPDGHRKKHLPPRIIRIVDRLTGNLLVEQLAEPDMREKLYSEFSHVSVVAVWASCGGVALFFLAPIALLILVLAPMIIATRTALSVSHEVAAGRLQMIRLTPLPREDIVAGYTFIALYRLRVLIWVALVSMFILIPMSLMLGILVTAPLPLIIGVSFLIIEPPMLLMASLTGIILAIKREHSIEAAVIAPLLILVVFAILALPAAIAIQGMIVGWETWLLVPLIYPLPYALTWMLLRAARSWM
jgi:hypothetical protein